jgi:hypothetical protein
MPLRFITFHLYYSKSKIQIAIVVVVLIGCEGLDVWAAKSPEIVKLRPGLFNRECESGYLFMIMFSSVFFLKAFVHTWAEFFLCLEGFNACIATTVKFWRVIFTVPMTVTTVYAVGS